MIVGKLSFARSFEPGKGTGQHIRNFIETLDRESGVESICLIEMSRFHSS